MSDDLRLGLFLGASADWFPLGELVADPPDHSLLRPDGTTISITAGGVDQFGGRGSIGDLRRVAAQLGPAAERLAAGEWALVRSGVTDVPEGLYLLFEPVDDSVVVSTALADELPWSTWFPDDPDHGDDLYARFAAERDELVAAASENRITPVRLDRDLLVAALRREERLAGEVVTTLGW